MRAFLLGLSLFPLAACSSPEYAMRVPQSPAPAMPLAPTTAPRPAPPAIAPATDEAATRAWLDQEIERNRYVPPPPPVEEREPVADAGRISQVVSDPRYDPYYQPYYRYGPRYESPPSRGTTFPLNTAVGAGIGAIIGHQSGHRGQGAWIGGSLGLLMDLSSHW